MKPIYNQASAGGNPRQPTSVQNKCEITFAPKKSEKSQLSSRFRVKINHPNQRQAMI
jgi:hypothetical protein